MFDAYMTIGETLQDTSLTATIQMASIDTDNADWDAHVHNPEIIDVEGRPTTVFRSARIMGDGPECHVGGDLTIGEITQRVSLAVEFAGIENFPGGPRHAGFEAGTEIRRKDFGIDIAMPPGVSAVALGDKVKSSLAYNCSNPRPPRSDVYHERGRIQWLDELKARSHSSPERRAARAAAMR
jgi:polyisoprenoid-binding protein YceI